MSGSRNPLRMELLKSAGMYVPPPQSCSQRRREYFVRANRILGSYVTIAAYSDLGKQWAEQQAKRGAFTDETPMKLTIAGRTMHANYRVVKRMLDEALPQLVNYIYLMVYGNFEAFLSDSICDALAQLGHSDPIEETIRLMMGTKWPGKIDRISQKLNLDLGKRTRTRHFKDLSMEFLGTVHTDPMELLEKMADVRHRLVHYSGRVDSLFASEYPNSSLSEGDLIVLPARLPYDVHFFFILLTGLIDEAFSNRFGWTRTTVSLEHLVE
jgi:hypothetical protein